MGAALLVWTAHAWQAFCPAFELGADLSGMANPHLAALHRASVVQARIAAAVLVVLGAAAIALFVFLFDDGDDMPPRAPVSAAEAVRGMASDGAPEFLRGLARRVGPVFRLPLPTAHRFHVVADHELARAILLDPLSAELAQADARLLTAAVPSLLSAGDPCEATAPALCAAQLGSRTELIVRTHVASLVAGDLSRAAASGEPLDVCPRALRLALGVACEAGFGYVPTATECDTFSSDARLSREDALSPLRALVPRAFAARRAATRAAERCLDFALRLLRGYRKLGGEARERMRGSLGARIDASGAYADDRARGAAIVTALLGAHESTAYTLAWALADLARCGPEQDELRVALRGAAEPAAVPEVHRAIKESTRLHCAGGSLRATGRAFDCPRRDPAGAAGGAPRARHVRRIPAGSIVQLHAFSIGRDDRRFEQPDEYVPSRWAGAAEPDGCPADIFPLALGWRDCLGQGHARIELSVALAAVVCSFELELAQPPRAAQCSMTALRPDGLALRLRRVKPG